MRNNQPLISDEERNKIVEAVQKAESTTSGEIVPMIVRESSSYPAAIFLFAIVYALFFASIITLFLMIVDETSVVILNFFHAHFYAQLASFIVFLMLFLIFLPAMLFTVKHCLFSINYFLRKTKLPSKCRKQLLPLLKFMGSIKQNSETGF
jgi:uncharacterized membrane protein